MINKVFFERFTTEELNELNTFIEQVISHKEFDLPQKIADSETSIRIKKHLNRMGFKNWKNLADTSHKEIINDHKLNSKTLKEIDKELKKRNLKWKK
ncbi:hypothetical protein [Reichenbachiella sp. MALMAid0571]|uniref:hypothetical protein n=1 Tax=Reichenbachiella sp. MALMAid0571 TaxID=3143939 RepID=UPI0032DEF6D5